jgi:hypothetical protein
MLQWTVVRAIRRHVLAVCVLATAWAAVSVAGASAASPVIKAGTPFASGPPAVAVDSSGNAVVAWANTKDLAGALNFVQYCVLPVGASSCSHSGNLVPADNAQVIDGTQVIADGSTLVILADVFGAQGTSAAQYEPTQEWLSTDGGATWTIVTGGISPASANLNADTGPLGAVIVPGTNVLGLGYETAGGPPTFNAFPLLSPPECSKANQCPFATLEPSSNPDQVTNGGGHFAAEAGAHPGVLGVFETLINDGGPFSCPSNTPDGFAFVYGAGNQGAGNSYNVSPGTPGSAWTAPAEQGECGMHYLTSGGGPAGFGILGDDEGHGTTVYQPFNSTTKTFGAKVTVSKQGELYPALSQDGAGGVYATYMNGGSGSPIALSYSADGGATWSGGTLDTYDGQANVTSAVNGAGQGWLTWQSNGSVFAQPFTAADAISPAAVSSGGSTNGVTVTVTVTCSSLPCTVTITITGPPGPARDARAKGKHKPIVLAKGRFTIHTRKAHKLTLHLTTAGKRFFRTHHHTTTIRLALTQKVHGRTKSRTKTIKVKFLAGHKK